MNRINQITTVYSPKDEQCSISIRRTRTARKYKYTPARNILIGKILEKTGQWNHSYISGIIAKIIDTRKF